MGIRFSYLTQQIIRNLIVFSEKNRNLFCRFFSKENLVNAQILPKMSEVRKSYFLMKFWSLFAFLAPFTEQF